MSKKRPVIEVPKRSMDNMLDFLGFGAIISMFVFGALSYSELPDSIPTKFGIDGEPTQWSPKAMIWLLPFIGVITWSSMYLLNKVPHIFNYLNPITPENALYQYTTATRFMRYLNTGISLIFAFLFSTMIQAGLGNQDGMPVWFLPVIIVGLFGSIIVYLFNASRKVKNLSPED
jgi:uncharacterized membrane protein